MSEEKLSANSKTKEKASGLQVLFWCSHVNPGGGIRLLLQMVFSISRQPAVQKVRIALPRGSINSQIIESLSSQGVEIFWLFSVKEKSIVRAFLEEAKHSREPVLIRKLKNGLLRIFFGKFKFADAQLREASLNCDLIYVIWPHRQSFPEVGLPVFCTWQDTTLLEFPEILGAKPTLMEFKNTENWLSNCSRVIVSSESTRIKMSKFFGEQCLTLPIIHHAINPDFASKANIAVPMLTDLLPEKWLICSSNITAHKNHYSLLSAWSRFSKREELPLLMIGSGTEYLNREPGGRYPETPQALRLLGLIHRKGLRPNKDFFALGYVDDSQVLPLIKNATALIMPSLTEGGGSFPVEEALDLGIPVLCSDIPVMREHLSRRSARIIWFDPESPDSILGALTELLEHYDQYKESAVLGMQDERPTWDDVASEYIKIFQETLRIQETSN